MGEPHEDTSTAMMAVGDMDSLALEKQRQVTHVVVYSGLSLLLVLPAFLFIVMFMVLIAMFLAGAYGYLVGGAMPMSVDLLWELAVALLGVLAPMVIFIVGTLKFGRSARRSALEYKETQRIIAKARHMLEAQGGEVSLIAEDVEGGELSMLEGEKGALTEARRL